MRNRMTAKILVAAAMGAAAVAAGVPAVYATTGTWNTSGNTTPQIVPTASPAGTLDGTLALQWLGGVIPNGVGDVANFTYNIDPDNNGFLIVQLAPSTTYGTINFESFMPGTSGNSDYRLTQKSSGSIIMDNGAPGTGDTAFINMLATNRASVTFNMPVNFVDNTTIMARTGGNQGGIGVLNFIAGFDGASLGNVTIEGGGDVSLGSGSASFTKQIIVNHGYLVLGGTSDTLFGSAAGAGLLINQGGTVGGNTFGTNTLVAPIHINGTGNHLNGAIDIDSTIAGTGGIVLDTDSWVTGGGSINAIISDAGAGRKLTKSFAGGSSQLTFRGANTYTGGTVIQPGAGILSLTTAGINSETLTGSLASNVTVNGDTTLRVTSTGNLTGGATVILMPGYRANFTDGNGNRRNPNGNFITSGGSLMLSADFDPTAMIDPTSSGGEVSLQVANTQPLNVAAWGDGTIRLAAQGTGAAAVTVNANGALSANAGANVLNLGYSGSNYGSGGGVYSTLQINSVIAAGTVAGVNLKAGVVAFANNNTYTGATEVGYDGTLNYINNTVTLGVTAGAVNVRAGGALNILAANVGAASNGSINVFGGGTATLANANSVMGGITVQGTNLASPVQSSYRGVVNYNIGGVAPTAGGGTTINAYGEVILNAAVDTTTTDNKFTLNDLGVLRANNAQWTALAGTASLVTNSGAILYVNAADAASNVPASFTTANLGSAGNLYYGIGDGATPATGQNWTLGTTSGTPWKGLAGGGDATDRSDQAPVDTTSHVITLSGAVDFVGIANNLTGTAGIGDFANVNTNAFRVFQIVVGGDGVQPLTIRGGGTVQMSNVNSTFTAPIVVDQGTQGLRILTQ